MQIRHLGPWLALAASSDGPSGSVGMTPLDWIVIALYALGMLAVGWYYARRTSTTDDYLLGGRTMSPWKVGLSLFATLLSTLTYLALPGEMIKYGPMVLSQLVSMPFVALVVGWLLIPFIMRLRVTSAYEILETRFGLSVRLVGSSMFLTLRLFWMSLVIYATANTVLVPILGLKPSAVPWICVALGLVTVAYTSLGGLRAVVLTDVLQTLVMFGGALMVLIVITVELGGVGQWWPRQWPAHWQPPVFWYDPQVRFTFVGGFLSMFTWHICTAGSDQMAIQRYLATRDARAARRTGYPMSGIRLGKWGVLGTSLYPADEPALPAAIHIRRALGGPAGSLVVTLAAAAVALALRAEGGALWWVAVFVFLDNLLLLTLGAFLPLGFTDGSTLLRWWGNR